MIELDVHTHLVPINAGRLQELPGVQWKPEDKALVLDGHKVGMKALFEPERLVAWMDRHDVRRALVSVPPPAYRQNLAPEAALAWVRYLNEELLSVCQASGGRLGALFYLPLENASLLAPLLQDFEAAAAFEGVALAAGGHPAIEYAHACYQPLWAWMNERGSFVFLHPGACRDERLSQFYLENLVGNPYETAVAAAQLVMGGIPAQFPRIRFCLAHAGGMFTALVGRMQRGFDTERPGVDRALEPPLQAARRFYADGIAHHPSMLRLAREVLGEDKLLFGSDWPFPMGIEQPGT
ncbi:amidohydrolase family protein [Ottowia sp. VDI28]|uniref:amidohydrolase family protein n=1 Tax=Ottowia sp. VDI28 TaxID=3133968 RepID=UPI003C2B2FA8